MEQLSTVNWPTSPRRNSPPLSYHHNSRAQSLLRKYSQTISKLVLTKFPHHLGENIRRLFRRQICLRRKSSKTQKYSKTFGLQEQPAAAIIQHAVSQPQPAIIQQAVSHQQPAAAIIQQAVSHQQPAAAIIQQAVSHQQPAAAIIQQAVSQQQPAIVQQSATTQHPAASTSTHAATSINPTSICTTQVKHM